MRSTDSKVQIPINKSLRDAIAKHASEQGFSSLQDFTRVLYSAVLRDNIQLGLAPADEKLSPEAETRYTAQLAELPSQVKSGEAKSFDNVDDFLADLHAQ
ncbi:MAG: hypothetical protein ACREGA_05075 [Candidatus Saccharimonadales bacterium]